MVSQSSPLSILYNDPKFRSFVKQTTGETDLHPYADPLSSINIHYANRGQELGWHFDNSSFAITLLIQKPEKGSRFEYVKDLRNADEGDMNFQGVVAVLEQELKPQVLNMDPGTLVLFRGRNSLHRVSPNEGHKTRMLAVLAYNNEPGVELSESARMTFLRSLELICYNMVLFEELSYFDLTLVVSFSHFFLASCVTAHAVLNKRDSRAAIGWTSLAWLAPFIGAIAYLIFGINRIQ